MEEEGGWIEGGRKMVDRGMAGQEDVEDGWVEGWMNRRMWKVGN